MYRHVYRHVCVKACAETCVWTWAAKHELCAGTFGAGRFRAGVVRQPSLAFPSPAAPRGCEAIDSQWASPGHCFMGKTGIQEDWLLILVCLSLLVVSDS